MKAKARPVDQWRLINFEKVLMTLVNSAPGQTEGSALTLLSDEIAKASQEEGFPIKPNTAAGVLQQLKRIRNKTTSFGGRWAATVECGIHRLIDAYGLSESYREPGFLDCPPEEKTLLAYVFASVDPKQWHGIYTTFKDIPEIKEASLIYGSSTVDAIIKIEAPTRKFNEVLIGTISDHPHIKTTQTLFAVSGSQWQKSQLERDAQLEDIPFYHSDAIQDDLTTPAVHADSLYPSPQINMEMK